MFEWVLACAGDAKTYSPFEIGARITEVGMLGVLALRMQKPILWDAENRRASELPEADAIIDPKPSTDAYLPRSLYRDRSRRKREKTANPQDPTHPIRRSDRKTSKPSEIQSSLTDSYGRHGEHCVVAEICLNAGNVEAEIQRSGNGLCRPVPAAVCDCRSHHGFQDGLARVVLDGSTKLGRVSRIH
jgi:hypothetical protein